MKPCTDLAAGFAALALLAGCQAGSDSQPDPANPGSATPLVVEIPVTTDSEVALEVFRAGQRVMDVGRYQQANQLFEEATAADSGFAYAYLNTASTAASAPEFNENLQLASRHLDGKSTGERLLVEITETYFDNDAEKRMGLALSLIEEYPSSPRAWLTLASTQSGLNQHEAARESLSRALELDPDRLAVHFSIWGSYLFNAPKNFDRAAQAMERAIEIAPDEAKAHENLGDVYRAMKQLERAREAYTRATQIDPTLSVASLKKGHINSFLGNFDEARADYDVGVEGAIEQNRITYANYRAFTHLHAGDPRAALDELGKLLTGDQLATLPEIQASGAKIFTLTNQATIALHHKFWDEAESILQQRARVMRVSAQQVNHPDFARQQEANILLWESQLAARRGDYTTARSKAEEHRALMANDNNPRRFEGYHGLIGLIELLQGYYPEAAKQLAKSDLNMIYVKYHLALAEEGAGNSEKAKQLFREVAEWNFNSVDFALVRQDALQRMG